MMETGIKTSSMTVVFLFMVRETSGRYVKVAEVFDFF